MKAYITIGIPGSGKTYWASNKAKSEGGYNLNLDDCRLVVSGDSANQACTGEAVKLHGAILDVLLNQGITIYVSDTNLHPVFRTALVDKCKSFGYEVIIVRFDTPNDLCKQRNSVRKSPVPDHAMDRMIQSMEEFRTTGIGDIII